MRYITVVLLGLVHLLFFNISSAMALNGIVPSRAALSKTMEGAVMYSRGDYVGAHSSYSAAIYLMENEEPRPVFSLVRGLLGSGWCCLKLNDFAGAKEDFDMAFSIVERGSLKNSLLRVEVLMAYAKLYDIWKDNSSAVKYYEKAIKSLYKENAAYWLTLASTLDDYAAFIRRLPEQQGWFGITGIADASGRDPILLEKRAGLLRKRAKKEPYDPE